MTPAQKLSSAIAFAARKHEDQKRKDGTPYIYHPLAVAAMVKENGCDVDYQVAAVLHDVLEDTDATEEDVALYGEAVLRAVKLLTRAPGADEEEYLAPILADPIAKAVKEADKIHNLRDLLMTMDTTEWDDRKSGMFMRNYALKSLKYYYGKFSPEVDDLIRKAVERTADPENC